MRPAHQAREVEGKGAASGYDFLLQGGPRIKRGKYFIFGRLKEPRRRLQGGPRIKRGKYLGKLLDSRVLRPLQGGPRIKRGK